MEDYIKTNNYSDNEIIIQLIDDYWLSVKKLAYTYVRDWSLAEDITQDVFINCYKNLNQFRGESNYKTWIFRITVNRCKDFHRSNWFRTLISAEDIKDKQLKKEKSAEHIYLQNSDAARLSNLVFTLPLKYREVIILFYYEELRLEEIENLLGLNKNTIKTRLRRGKALLKKAIERSDM